VHVRSEEPEPERDELADRVRRLEERMTQFEQDLHTMHVPAAEPQDTDVTAPPALSEEPIQAEDHRKAPEGPWPTVVALGSTAGGGGP
jgi:hypothetical protein